jgi:fluoride exporter
MQGTIELLWGAALVTVGATFGTPARFFVSGVIARRFGETIPWGTLVVNVSGCLVMGFVAAFAIVHGLSGGSDYWLLVATGFLGSYTTVSSFALQTRALLRDGELRLAGWYVLLSVVACLGMVAAGLSAGTVVMAGHFP